MTRTVFISGDAAISPARYLKDEIERIPDLSKKKFREQALRTQCLVIVDLEEPQLDWDPGLIEIINQRRKMKRKTKVIFSRMHETGTIDQLQDQRTEYYSRLGFAVKDQLFLLNTCAPALRAQPYQIERIDFFATDAYLRCHRDGHPYCLTPLRQRGHRMNLLMGKILKPYRPRILYLLHQQGLLDTAVTGILTNDQELEQLRGEPALYEFLKARKGSYDSVETETLDTGTTSMGWSGSTRVYDHSQLSFIVETWINNTAFFTEKTYRPIINASPFILLGCTQALKHLQQRGFQTFSAVTDESYDDPQWSNDRNRDPKLQRAVAQAQIFLDSIPTVIEPLQEIVNYNQQHLLRYGQAETARVTKILRRFIKQ